MEDFLFIKGLDIIGNDIKRVNLSEKIDSEILKYSAFNTLGFVKNKIDTLQKSEYFGPDDGIFIKNILSNFPIKVINLDRRPDRWEKVKNLLDSQGVTNYERYSAVDGTKLEITEELKYLFRNNDFNFRQGFIGCALSHMNLWKQLVDSNDEYFIIMEDDIELIDDFKNKLNIVCQQMIQNPYVDLHFLGYFYWQGKPEKNNDYPVMEKMDIQKYMGGFYGYIINKSAAYKLLHIAKYNGIQNGIDRFAHIHFNKMIVTHSEPHIIHSDYYTTGKNVDSDIQKNTLPIGFKTTEPELQKNTLPVEQKTPVNVKSKDGLIRVKFLCNYTCETWNNIKVENTNDADYFVIINKPIPGEYYNPFKTILIQKDKSDKSLGKWSTPEKLNLMKVITYEEWENVKEKNILDIIEEIINTSKISKKYITPLIHAGLGNQFFMIANAYTVSKDTDRELIINDSYFGTRKMYWNTLFKNIKTKKINLKEYKIQKDTEFEYHNIILNENENKIALEGYFQSEKFFEKYKEDIKNLFKLPEDLEIFSFAKISSYGFKKDIVAVHIRRGDYVGSDLHTVLSLDYYNKAMKFIKEQNDVEFLFFADDKEWVYNNFENVIICECEEDYQEFSVMKQCKHFIIANSSFSWWASYLSDNVNKIVIAPQNWFMGNKFNYKDIYYKETIIM